MKIRLSTPAKTFLVGEYLALTGGPALIVCTKPRFELEVRPTISSEMQVKGIHPQSPGGKILQRFKSDFFYSDLEFFDPYKEKGGLGASSAQFAMLMALDCAIRRSRTKIFTPSLIKSLNNFEAADGFHYLRIYRECAWDGSGLPPSGNDVIAQLSGGISFVSANDQKVEKLSWGFENLDFALIRTGFKLATHEHLKRVEQIPVHTLKGIVDTAMQALLLRDEETFISSINQYAKALAQNGWVAELTQQLIKKLSSALPLLAIKGCGAMGADIILALYNKSESKKVDEYLKSQNLEKVATSADISRGLEVTLSEPLAIKMHEAHI